MKLALIGYGNLGMGLSNVLLKKKEFLSKYEGFEPKVVAAVDSRGAVVDSEGLNLEVLIEKKRESGSVIGYSGASEGMSSFDVIRNVDYDVLIELTPTDIEDGEPALTHIKEAMDLGRHVVTSNKGPLVLSFQELKALAEEKNVEFRYSATVGGAVPVMGLAQNQLYGDTIREIRGVLNGTTNYVLTRIAEEGAPFDVVLQEAKELGIAEKDPTLDVEGVDTASKMAILTNALLDRNVCLEDVDVEGITRIGPEVLRLAKETGYEVRLVGIANSDVLEVAPKLVPSGNPLAVRGTLNSVTLKTDLAKEVTITGFGAGSKETSSSILSDVVDIYLSDKN